MARKESIESRIANRIRSLRTQQGITQTQLARLANTSRSQVAAVERGDRAPTVSTLEAFARGLRVGLLDLLRDDAKPEQNSPDRAQRLVAKLRSLPDLHLAVAEAVVNELDRQCRQRGPSRTK